MRWLILTLLFGPGLSPGIAQGMPSYAHVRALNAKYPYGLIGHDFNILNVADLAANAREAEPSPFPPKLPGYSYWQCFQIKNTQFKCKYGGEDNDSGSGPQFFLLITIRDELGHQEYLSRRLMSQGSCIAHRREWMKLTKHQHHVCVSGDYIYDQLENGENVRSWAFDKYKTKSGCDSYFDGKCSASRDAPDAQKFRE